MLDLSVMFIINYTLANWLQTHKTRRCDVPYVDTKSWAYHAYIVYIRLIFNLYHAYIKYIPNIQLVDLKYCNPVPSWAGLTALPGPRPRSRHGECFWSFLGMYALICNCSRVSMAQWTCLFVAINLNDTKCAWVLQPRLMGKAMLIASEV